MKHTPEGVRLKALKRLKSGKTISTWQAIQWWKHTRLAARIKELRNAGHPIKTTMVERDGKRFARYSMEEAA